MTCSFFSGSKERPLDPFHASLVGPLFQQCKLGGGFVLENRIPQHRIADVDIPDMLHDQGGHVFESLLFHPLNKRHAGRIAAQVRVVDSVEVVVNVPVGRILHAGRGR